MCEHCNQSEFQMFWKSSNDPLTEEELSKIRTIVRDLEGKKKTSSYIIAVLQRTFPKLSEKWRAERAYWTEVKAMESKEVESEAKELDLQKFIIIPSPNACDVCLKVSGKGKKVFTSKDLYYNGRDIPPIHPNCFCVLLPISDEEAKELGYNKS